MEPPEPDIDVELFMKWALSMIRDHENSGPLSGVTDDFAETLVRYPIAV